MVVWLASYPRSGNSFARIVLSQLLGLSCGTVYESPDTEEVRKMRDLVGETGSQGLSVADMANSTDLFMVKTHELPGQDEFPAIYLVRDGRDAMVSYAHFILHTQRGIETGSDRTAFLDALQELITTDHQFGGWTSNVLSWRARAGQTVFVKYEDLVADPLGMMQRSLASLGMGEAVRLRQGDLPSFDELHRMFPWFFRKGKSGGWRSEMPADLEELFWERHGEAMDAFQYGREQSQAV